jgi:hypothetical protein
MSSARAKTMEHLRELVTAVAVMGALSAEASACGGYGVVDPLPPPSKCNDVVKDFSATVKVEANGDLTILVHSKNGNINLLSSTKVESGGKLLASSFAGNGDLEVRVAPDPGVTVRLQIANSCTTQGYVVAVLTPSAGDAGATYAVTFEPPP